MPPASTAFGALRCGGNPSSDPPPSGSVLTSKAWEGGLRRYKFKVISNLGCARVGDDLQFEDTRQARNAALVIARQMCAAMTRAQLQHDPRQFVVIDDQDESVVTFALKDAVWIR